MVAESATASLSCFAATVMVWVVFQFCVVKVSVAGEKVTSVWLLAGVMTTLLVGKLVSLAV